MTARVTGMNVAGSDNREAVMVTRALSRSVGMAILFAGVMGQSALSQESIPANGLRIPPTATVLEGTPTVRVDSSEGVTTRRLLDHAEATKSRLKVSVVDGQYYWTSRENQPLRLGSAGAFTYLSSEPGQYIRFTRIKDRITYVEHVDVALGSVTWWGELKIVTGGQP
jgi:hypothetical protein